MSYRRFCFLFEAFRAFCSLKLALKLAEITHYFHPFGLDFGYLAMRSMVFSCFSGCVAKDTIIIINSIAQTNIFLNSILHRLLRNYERC